MREELAKRIELLLAEFDSSSTDERVSKGLLHWAAVSKESRRLMKEAERLDDRKHQVKMMQCYLRAQEMMKDLKAFRSTR
jgi:hypothetical protein